jgi:t-SNARE complex subunit (syntaxin)
MYERNNILCTKINNSLSEFKQGINKVNLEKDNMLRAINEKSMKKIRMYNEDFFENLKNMLRSNNERIKNGARQINLKIEEKSDVACENQKQIYFKINEGNKELDDKKDLIKEVKDKVNI